MKTKTLTRRKLALILRNEMDIPHVVSKQCVKVFFDSIIEEVIQKEKKASFREFGTFLPKKHPFVKKKRNPKTGGFFSTKGSVTMKFKPIVEFKNKISEIPLSTKKLKKVKQNPKNKNFYTDLGLDKIEEIKKKKSLNPIKHDIITAERQT